MQLRLGKSALFFWQAMDGEGDRSPYSEIIPFTYLYLRIILVGRNQPAFTVMATDVFHGIFAIQLAHGYLLLRRVAVTLVYDQDVTALDV